MRIGQSETALETVKTVFGIFGGFGTQDMTKAQAESMSIEPKLRVRRFNRAVVSELGVLDASFLGLGRPLGAARVLNAVGHGQQDVATIREYLGLDSGLMSGLLRRLELEGVG